MYAVKLLNSKNKMGILFIALGGFFLFNPIVALVDVLPDAIGYFLIWLGLWKLSDINDSFAESFHYARTMLLVSVGELVMWWFCYSFLPGITEEMVTEEIPMAILLGSTVWAILNWCFLIPLFRNLFEGFATMAVQCDGCVILREKRGVPMWLRMAKRSIRLAMVLPVLSLLPELSVMTTTNLRSPTPTASFDWYRFVTLMRGAAAIVAGVIGIVWLISFLRFFAKMAEDTPYTDFLQSRYECEILPQKNWLFYRRFSLGVTIATVALVFSADFRLDNHSVLPSYVLVLLICIAYALMGKRRLKDSAFLYTSGALLFAVSIAFERLLDGYLSNHIPEDALHLPNAYSAYEAVRMMELAESICTGVFLLAFLLDLWRMLARLGKEEQNGLFNKHQKQHRGKLCLALLFAMAASVADAFNAFVRLEIKYMWLVAFVLSIAMILTIRSILTELCDEILSRAQAERMYKKHSNDAY